jgi:hypothetical protein
MNKFNQYVIMGLGSSPIHFGLEGIRLMVRIFLKRSNNYKYANVLFIKKNIFNIFFVVFEMALGVAEPPHGQMMALGVVQPPPTTKSNFFKKIVWPVGGGWTTTKGHLKN